MRKIEKNGRVPTRIQSDPVNIELSAQPDCPQQFNRYDPESWMSMLDCPFKDLPVLRPPRPAKIKYPDLIISSYSVYVGQDNIINHRVTVKNIGNREINFGRPNADAVYVQFYASLNLMLTGTYGEDYRAAGGTILGTPSNSPAITLFPGDEIEHSFRSGDPQASSDELYGKYHYGIARLFLGDNHQFKATENALNNISVSPIEHL